MENLDLNDVRVFAVVGQTGTLTAAGRKLGLPASTVSRSLTRLEKHLGVLLLQRSSRGFSLTSDGNEYLRSCRSALQILSDGSDAVSGQRDRLSGLIRVACPVTMLRTLFGPLLHNFLARYPDLRVELSPYSSDWNREPRDDIDVFFKVRGPKDSRRRVRLFPGVARGIFASPEYLAQSKAPAKPEDLSQHACIGSGNWKLLRRNKTSTPDISFRVAAGDPFLHLDLALRGVGIAILPLYMARQPDHLHRLVPLLRGWKPEPITLCALFSGPSRLTPKVQAFLDFMSEHLGTALDPRAQGIALDDLFTPLGETGKSGP